MRLRQEASDLNIDLELSDEFVDMIAGQYDVAIHIGEFKDSRLMTRRLAPVRRVLCAAPAHLERAGRPMTIDDFAQHICLAPEHRILPRLEGPGGAFSPPAKRPLHTNSSEVVREAALADCVLLSDPLGMSGRSRIRCPGGCAP